MSGKSCSLKSKLIMCLVLMSCITAADTRAWEQSLRFDRLTTEDGLSDMRVDSIAQDQQGYMWFGAVDGLNKFDGYDFTFYAHDPDDPTSISGGQIIDLLVDSRGVLWIAADELNSFDREKEVFTHFRHDPDDANSISGKVLSIYEDSKGTLWFGTWTQGLNRYDRATETFTHFQHDPGDPRSLPAGPVRSIYEDSDGVLWVGTYITDGSANLVRFDPASETFQPVLACANNQSSCAHPLHEGDRPELALVAGMLEDRSGTLWIGGFGIIRFDKESNSYHRYFDDPDNDDYPHINNFTGRFVEDDAGLLWFGETYNGLHSFDPETEIFSQYLNNPGDPKSIGSNDLFTIFEDRDGMIWVATYNGGISRFNPRHLFFSHYKQDPKDPTSLAGDKVAAIAEDANGILWVAAGGLNKIDRDKGVIALYQNDPENPDSLHSNDIRNLLFDDQGILWLGTRDGLSRFDPTRDKFQHIPVFPENSAFIGKAVSSLIKGDNGMIWLATSVGLTKYDPETAVFTHYQPEIESSPDTMGTQYRIMRARSGHIWVWVGAGMGAAELFRFDPRTESFSYFKHDPQDTHSLRNSTVRNMYEDGNGDIWLEMGSGIDRFDPESEQFIHYQATDDLPDHLVHATVIEDLSGDLWFWNGGQGLTRFNPADESSKTFGLDDGFLGESLTEGILSQTGEIILGGENGLIIFDPDLLRERQRDLKVVFTDFRLMNQSVAVSSTGKASPLQLHINSNPDITLTHRDYLLSFEFAALNYVDAMATRYAYRLEGFDQDWIETDASNRNATYTNLPAGDYVLQVKASASGLDGLWSRNTAALKLKILPPPWETWWAYTLYIVTFLTLLFAYIRWRTHTLQKQAIELESTVEQRTRQIREHEQVIQHQADSLQELLQLKEKLYANVSHEFRTPLTLILGPVRRMLRKEDRSSSRELLEVVQRNSERLLRLVDQLLSLSRSRSAAHKYSTASAQSLVSHVVAITEPFRSLAEEKGLSLSVGKTADLWVNCTPGSLEKILMNLLSNAIKYTAAGGSITVGVQRDGNDFAVISVTDTGIGIPPDQHAAVFERFHRIGDAGETVPGAGIGLALVKELAESYGGSVSLVSSPGQGTTVRVRLPRVEPAEPARVNKKAVQVSAAARREVNNLVESGPSLLEDDKDQQDSRRSVLIVEDNPDMQTYLHELLADDYECLVAGNGRDGLEVALEQVPDIVVSDVMMPEMDGYELTQALKEDQRSSHIPVIMLTARSDQESRLKGLRERADDYLIKPFDDEELLLRISNQLAARDIIKARFSGRIYLDEPLSTELNERERQFLERFEELLQQDHADPNLDIGIMASRMAVSTRQLQRKLKALTGHSPAEYLRAYRLKKAAKLLKKGGQITQVAMDVGFSSQAYFGTCFKAQFGLTPSQFQKE